MKIEDHLNTDDNWEGDERTAMEHIEELIERDNERTVRRFNRSATEGRIDDPAGLEEIDQAEEYAFVEVDLNSGEDAGGVLTNADIIRIARERGVNKVVIGDQVYFVSRYTEDEPRIELGKEIIGKIGGSELEEEGHTGVTLGKLVYTELEAAYINPGKEIDYEAVNKELKERTRGVEPDSHDVAGRVEAALERAEVTNYKPEQIAFMPISPVKGRFRATPEELYLGELPPVDPGGPTKPQSAPAARGSRLLVGFLKLINAGLSRLIRWSK